MTAFQARVTKDRINESTRQSGWAYLKGKKQWCWLCKKLVQPVYIFWLHPWARCPTCLMVIGYKYYSGLRIRTKKLKQIVKTKRKIKKITSIDKPYQEKNEVWNQPNPITKPNTFDHLRHGG